MIKQEQRMCFLRLVSQEKDILFGAFSDSITKDLKVSKWKQITDQMHSMGIISHTKDYAYVRDTFWQNIKRTSLAKREGASRGNRQQITAVDEMVFEIIDKDAAAMGGIRADPLDLLVCSSSEEENIDLPPATVAGSFPPVAVIPVSAPTQRKTTNKKKIKFVTTGSISYKDDEEERDLKRRKLMLQAEYLELQNYKTKLEIMSLEKSLNIPVSKFTVEVKTENMTADGC